VESIILTICSLLLLYSSFGANFNAQNFIPNAQAETANKFTYHLAPAKRINFPYRVRGVPQFDVKMLTAQNAAVIDEDTGRVLFEKDSYDKKSIASLTKLMTAVVWWEINGDLKKVIKIEGDDYRDGGISYFISGESVTAKDLLYTGLIASSNSAMAALVRSTGLGTESFVELMNGKAQELGMKNTRFKEPTGLDFKNISTATDLFILTREAFKNPVISEITQLEEYKFRPLGKSVFRVVRNTNWLLSDSLNEDGYQIVGGKTGYIDESGYNLVVKAFSKEKNKNLIIVILGSADKGSRFEEAKKLIEWSYSNHVWSI